MSSWSEGYTTDVQYTSHFHSELSPTHIAFTANVTGYRAPDVTKPFAYCELGSGQGVSLNLIAAGHPDSRFWGFDFNPGQTANARRLAEQAGLTNVVFEDWSFAQAIENASALPKFDFITLHGIYSWVSEDNRREIVAFIDRTLKPGGLVYISYNALPGWAGTAPFRHLARQHLLRFPGRSDRQVPKFLELSDMLENAGAAYYATNPSLASRLKMIRSQPPAYFAHEFLNENWQPFYVDEVARQMSGARLEYMASATLPENIDVAAVPPGLPALIGQVAPDDRVWQELLRDYANNKAFRRDIYGRGVNTVTSSEQLNRFLQWSFALAVPRDEVRLKFNSPLGEIGGAPEIYNPIFDRLAKGAAGFDELLQLDPGIDRGRLTQALTLLVHSRQVSVLSAKPDPKAVRPINTAIVEAAYDGVSLGVLVASAARTGFAVTGNDLFAAGAMLAGRGKSAEDAAEYVYEKLSARGRAIQKEAKPLTSRKDATAYLVTQFTTALLSKSVIWKTLGIV
ncbi:class I SAM-dependent methyltransferase [Caulobacter sp. 73W]|uniref:Class I SAM-dependent methyltransferase n=1 Tax=Caulobacter sp. 73W TaxID=3161137 RepID=A0AB39KZA8_9CAUL